MSSGLALELISKQTDVVARMEFAGGRAAGMIEWTAYCFVAKLAGFRATGKR